MITFMFAYSESDQISQDGEKLGNLTLYRTDQFVNRPPVFKLFI